MALLLYAPVVAYLVRGPLALYTIPRDTWLLSATVAGLVGFVLIVDDVERRKAAAPDRRRPGRAGRVRRPSDAGGAPTAQP